MSRDDLNATRRRMRDLLDQAAALESSAASEPPLPPGRSGSDARLREALELKRRVVRRLAAVQEKLNEQKARGQAAERASSGQKRELEAQLEEAKSALRKAALAWEEQRSVLEAKLHEERRALEAAREELEKARAPFNEQRAELEARIRELHSRLQNARAAWERERLALESKVEETNEKFQAAYAMVEHDRARRDREHAELRGLHEKLRRRFEKAREAWRRKRESLVSRLREARERAQAAETEARKAVEMSPVPPVEPVLEPVWRRISALLLKPLSQGYAHLRTLAAAPLPKGQRAVLRLAAGNLAQALDRVKIVGQFLEEGGPAPAPGQVERSVEAALPEWEAAFRKRRIAIVRQLGAGLPAVRFRQETLRVALYQAIRNAYDAMPRGGRLVVRADKDRETGGVRVTFSDTGPGFSEEALESLFMPFSSRKTDRLGLGLALIRATLRGWDGDAEAGNVPGGGAALTLRFPPA
ncbi:MAG: ATP-binding protein [Elusimicrobiota bacterium]